MRFKGSIFFILSFFASYTTAEINDINPSTACQVFPSVAQSHKKSAGKLSIDGALSAKIIQTHGLDADNKFVLRFDENNLNVKKESCQSSENLFTCKVDSSISYPELNVQYFGSDFSNVNAIDIPVDGNKTLGSNGVCKNAKFSDFNRLKNTCVFNNVQSTGGHLTLNEGVYWFNKLELFGGTKEVDGKIVSVTPTITMTGPVRIYVSKGIYFYKDAQINNDGNADDFILLTQKSAELRSKSVIKALIYAQERLTLSGDTHIDGAVSVADLSMNTNAQIYGDSLCIAPPELKIIPTESIFDTCDSHSINFSTEDPDGTIRKLDGELSLSFTDSSGKDTSTGACFKVENKPGACKKNTKVSLVDGRAAVDIISNKQETIYIRSDLTITSSSIDVIPPKITGPYRFRHKNPRLVFGTSDIKVIAGKPRQISVTATSNSCGVIESYSGKKTLDVIKKYKKPTFKPGKEPLLTFEPAQVGDQLQLTFTEGQTAFDAKYMGAGEVEIELNDTNWNILRNAPFTSEEVKARNNGETELLGVKLNQTMKGAFNLLSRPYSFGICNVDRNSLIAGEKFGLNIKPVAWRSGDDGNILPDASNPAEIDVTNKSLCQRGVVAGFWQSIGGSSVSLTGASLLQNGAGDLSGTKNISAGKKVSDLSWSDVGPVKLQATMSNYFGMSINPSFIKLGPFEPDHFLLSDNRKVIAANTSIDGSVPFSYMNQPFTGQFEIKAMTGGNNPQAVKNYHKLASGQVNFDITAVSEQGGDDFTNRLKHPQSQSLSWAASSDGTSVWKFEDTNMILERSNEPDGPFKQLVLGVKPRTKAQIKNSDRVINKGGNDLGAKWGVTDVRYGRLRISDAAGNLSDDLTVPVYAEYRDGDKFVVNTDDNHTSVSLGANSQEEIYKDGNAPVDSVIVFDGGKTEKNMENGVTAFLVKPKTENNRFYRKQFRLWQCLKSTSEICNTVTVNNQPWLLYEGQGNSDNPSAIITLGSYRGNDRVIYQGEKGANVAR
ncbi:DUF6701 domain-containing protein [Veronia pacifica]|uniref:MSHA biogenesis protein MshQ n=1 Tax=Veronia pacifica TaxID=1080227 RepID=A0A1C3ELP3_9GAMM|nr:DUF6701 domain-containing protein [Veronia pacifica]ODA34140.1 hypothetical protein A8L45_07625 [Veronia pacifica]